MHRTAAILMSIVPLLAAGCVQSHYVVELRPDGESIQRTLTTWRETSGDPPQDSPLPDDELQRIARLYETRRTVEVDGRPRVVFSGQFGDTMPADVGGAGSYQRFTSALGQLAVYVERFRGSDDLDAELNRRRTAADRLVDLLIGWFHTEVKDPALRDRVQQLLDGDVRQDLKNLGTYAWTLNAVSAYDQDLSEEFLVRVGQYLVERNYLSVADLPRLYDLASENEPTRAAQFLQHVVARKVGIAAGEPIPDSLGFLADPARVKRSLEAYLRETEAFRQRQAEWEASRRATPDDQGKPPQPLDLLSDLLGDSLFRFSFAATDAVAVRLQTGVEPFATNGQWDAQSGRVSWSENLHRHAALPMLVYAAWSLPDTAAQTKYFGRPLLAGQDLGRYVSWYASLAPQEAVEWDALLAQLSPGPELATKLRAFRFSTDPPSLRGTAAEQQSPSRADRVRTLILEQLAQAAP